MIKAPFPPELEEVAVTYFELLPDHKGVASADGAAPQRRWPG